VAEDRISEAEVTQVLQDIPIPLGAGRTQVSLMDLVPANCMADLIKVLEDFKDEI
jgi:hypothetical protein